MSSKLKLKTIKLETADGKTVELSLAEAKDLHDQLHELFGPKYVPQTPIVIERDRPWLPTGFVAKRSAQVALRSATEAKPYNKS